MADINIVRFAIAIDFLKQPPLSIDLWDFRMLQYPVLIKIMIYNSCLKGVTEGGLPKMIRAVAVCLQF
jgi:hypothetical protein